MRHLPRGSALHREMDPLGADWTVDTYIQALIVDELAAANWQRGNAGAERPTRRPEPMWRPPDPNAPPRKSYDDRVREWKARHCR